MKFKIIGLICCVCIIAVAVFVPYIDCQKIKRYHQHLEAENKEECVHDEGYTDLCTHLPIVCIDTGNVEIPGASIDGQIVLTEDGLKSIDATIRIIDNYGKMNHTTDSPVLTSSMQIGVRGKSSRCFIKRGYLIKLTDSAGNSSEREVLGMAAHDEWVLHGPYLDKTLLRNYMFYNISAEIMDYAPNVRFCEVVLNGQYNGVYVMTETLTRGKSNSRLPLAVTKRGMTVGTYLLRLDTGSPNPIKNIGIYPEYLNSKLNIVYPSGDFLDQTLANEIKSDFLEFEEKLKSGNCDINEIVDLKSFADYFLINEITTNYDAGRFSTYIYKGADGRFRMVVWDFNNCCDNYQHASLSKEKFELWWRPWFRELFTYEEFSKCIIEEYNELRKTYFSEEYLYSYIDDVVEYLGDAVDRNFERWPTAFTSNLLSPKSRNQRTYEEAVADMKEFFEERFAWLDENIYTIQEYYDERNCR